MGSRVRVGVLGVVVAVGAVGAVAGAPPSWGGPQGAAPPSARTASSAFPSPTVVTPAAPAPSGPSAFVPVTAERLLDTRTAGQVGYTGDKPAAGETVALQVAGAGTAAVPGNAKAVVLNVTGAQPTGKGYVTVWPCGATQPATSSLNLGDGTNTANLVVTALGAGGAVCLYTSAGAHLVADVAGWFPAASTLAPVAAERLLDTRAATQTGYTGDRPAAGDTVTVQVSGAGSPAVPPTAAAVLLNVAGVSPDGAGEVTAWPCGAARPAVASLSLAGGTTAAQLAVSGLGTGGTVCLHTTTGAHLVADVTGWFPAGTTPTWRTPQRLLDTRPGSPVGYSGAKPAAGDTLEVVVAGTGPAVAADDAAGVLLTVTGREATGRGFLTVWPCGSPRPTASTVNLPPGQTRSNVAVAAPGTGGKVCVYTAAGAHVTVDLTGFLPSVGPWRQVSAGSHHTCAVTSTRTLWCWGDNEYGQLGDGTLVDRAVPVAVDTSLLPAGTQFSRVTVGEFHTCAITTGSDVYCWGRNVYGQVGDGTSTDRTTPVPVDVSAMSVVVHLSQIAAGRYHTCGTDSMGQAWCWGYNSAGQLGDGSQTIRRTATAVDTSAVPVDVGLTQISAGGDHTCAVDTAGVARCWGYNGEGELGDGTTTDRTTPVVVTGLPGGTALGEVDAAAQGTCAVDGNGAAWCWGGNADGQVGDGTTTERHAPVAVAGLPAGTGVARMAVGEAHACAVLATGRAWCWGRNDHGQLGVGTTTGSLVPQPVDVAGVLDGAVLNAAAAGRNGSCAVSTVGKLYCWGANADAQLGDGTTTDRPSPVRVTSTP